MPWSRRNTRRAHNNLTGITRNPHAIMQRQTDAPKPPPEPTGFFGSTVTYPLDGDLLHYWEMNAESGQPRIDIHGWNNLTDNGGVPRATGINNYGANFTTAGDYLSGAEVFRNKTGVAVSAWVKFDDVTQDGNFHYIFREINSGGSWVRFGLHRRADNAADNSKLEIYWYTDNSGTGYAVTSTNKVVADTWYNVVTVIDQPNEKIYLYVNGSEWINYDATGMVGSEDAASTTGIEIGGYSGVPVDGVVDEFAVWAAVPSDPEAFAQAMYNCGNGRFYVNPNPGYFDNEYLKSLDDNLLHYWKMEETSGNARVDSHGSNNLTDTGGVARATGISNYGANIQNTGEYLSGATVLRNKTKLLLCAWMKFDSATNAQNQIFREVLGSSGGSFFVFRPTGGSNIIRVYYLDGDTGVHFSDSANTVSADTWYCLVAGFDADNDKLYLYLNGVEWINATHAGMVGTDDIATTNGFLIGNNPGNDTHVLDGVVDEVAVWGDMPANLQNFALALYNSGAGRFYSV